MPTCPNCSDVELVEFHNHAECVSCGYTEELMFT